MPLSWPGYFGIALASLLLVVQGVAADQAEPAAAIALLEQHCLECHGGKQKKAGLDLSTREGLMAGGESGPALVPGQTEAGLLLKTLRHEVDPGMPYKKPKLAPSEIEEIKSWLAKGAVYPRKLTAAKVASAESTFWSFGPLHRPALPLARNRENLRNPIDQFLAAEWEKAGLSPAQPTTRARLIRRLSYDVIGLPPTPEQVKAFVEDPRENAYELLVDSMLANPGYGERWARHWLDLARYADSNGYERDLERPNAWRYRDYVINALNSDVPYNQFVRWQIAGDEYEPENPDALAATGFCVAGPRETTQVTEKNRYGELDDILSTTGTTVLGLTVGCARCHDHKYDPFSQRDYYQLLAAFTTSEPRETFMTPPASKTAYEVQDKAYKKSRAALERWVLRKSIEHGADSAGALEKVLSQQELTEWDRLKKAKAVELQASWKYLVRLQVLTDKESKPVPTYFLRRGEPSLKGEELPFQFPGLFQGGKASCPKVTPTATTTGRRRELAEWLVDEKQGAGSLAARVMVNRLWQHHFGEGLVKTPSDFGYQGDRPAMPELLEWLACELVAQQWHLKPLHRLMLLSTAYQLGANSDPKSSEKDPENRYWSGRPLRRLEAESIRDAMLCVSGSLNSRMSGPGVRPWIHPDVISTGSTAKWPVGVKDGPDTWRRSVYLFLKRSVLMPMMEVFDCSDTTFSCGRRQETTVPAQALELLNSAFVRDQALRLAQRIQRETDGTSQARVQRAFQLALSRDPTARESAAAQRFFQEAGGGEQETSDFCHALLNSNEFIHVD